MAADEYHILVSWLMQYKFIVDGEWRHDDQQSVMSDPLGNVNNWVLVKEPEHLSSVEGLGQLGASMDVDHDMPPLTVLSSLPETSVS